MNQDEIARRMASWAEQDQRLSVEETRFWRGVMLVVGGFAAGVLFAGWFA